MYFHVALIHSTTFIFALYCPQYEGSVIFNWTSEMIDNIFTKFPLTSVHICSDFNIHHKDWLVHSNKTGKEGRYYGDFSIAYELTQIIEELTPVPNVMWQQANLFNLFLTYCTDECLAKVLPTIGTSDHSLSSQCPNWFQTNDIPRFTVLYNVFSLCKGKLELFSVLYEGSSTPNLFQACCPQNFSPHLWMDPFWN